MADLVALRPIVFGNTEYQAGDVLPSNVPDAETWLECGSAKWNDDPPLAHPKAELKCATPGLPGLAVGGEQAGEDLVGKLPPRRKRNRG